MSVSDDLNEIDRILEDEKPIIRSVPRSDANRAAKLFAARREVLSAASDRRLDLMRATGFRTFSTAQAMLANLRVNVMLKMIRQAHEAELAEPGDPQTSSIVGTPEW